MSWRALLLAIMVWPFGSAADLSAPLVFEHLTIRDGLSQNTVLATYQDSTGYLWFATQNGLNRYNGYDVTVWFRTPAQNAGLASDYILDMAEDADGDLWLATVDAGVVRWRRNTETFESYHESAGLDQHVGRRRTTSVSVDLSGNVWVGTEQSGIYALNSSGQLVYASAPDEGTHGLSVRDVLARPDGQIWVATRTGLHRLDAVKGEQVRVALAGDGTTPVHAVTLLEGAAGDIWVGTQGAGLWRVNAATLEATRVSLTGVREGRAEPESIKDLHQDAAGRIWIATTAGVVLLDTMSGEVRHITHDRADPYSIASNDVMSVFQDRSGVVWVGTRGGGVSRWNSRSWSFGPRTPAWLSGVHVNAFAEADNGEYWIGTIGAGLVRLDAEGHRRAAFSLRLQDDRIMSLLRDQRGQLWIGTLSGGLHVYRSDTDTLSHFPVDPGRADALRSPGIMALAEGRDGAIWVGGFNGGVARVDPVTGAIERLSTPAHAKALDTARATALAIGVDDEIWIGTESLGLWRVDTASGDLQSFRYQTDDPDSLPGDTIYGLHVDDDGDVWVGTGGFGLGRLSRESLRSEVPQFERFSTATGLVSTVIYGIVPDAEGQLWISSNNGLMQFDPRDKTVRSYHREHGLFGDEFNFGAYFRSPSGRHLFGGTGGFNLFDAGMIERNTVPAPMVLTGIQRLADEARFTTPVARLQQLTLTHRDEVISFDYALLDFAAPGKNRYSYQLDGFDRRWSAPSERRRTTYTNLDAGEYIFRVRGANGDGVWSDRPLTIALTVRPAPWVTWWAYALYTVLAFLVIAGILRWRFRRQEHEARFNHLAYYDRATGVPNRYLFEQRANEAIYRAAETGEAVAVVCIRLAVQRAASDTLGQRALDDVLREVVTRFIRAVHGAQGEVGRRDFARLDSDTFAAYIREKDADGAALHLGERLIRSVSQPLQHGSHRIPVAAHVGIAAFPQHARDLDTMLAFARTAASTASGSLKSRALFYDRAMTAQATIRVSLETQLREAIEHDRLQVHYQPRVDRENAVTGMEALLRWPQADGSWRSPSEFIPLAEESELIVELDSWVIGRVCADVRDSARAGQPLPPVAVNVSAYNLDEGPVVQTLIDTCRQYGVEPGRIEIELTESAVVNDVTRVQASINALKAAGFSISLDDFGTGYSSLAHLQQFAIDTIKIDRSFVSEVDQNADQAAICSAVVALARSLQIRVVAEGVETPGQWSALRALGCEEMQGYLFRPPLPLPELRELLDATTSAGAGSVLKVEPK